MQSCRRSGQSEFEMFLRVNEDRLVQFTQAFGAGSMASVVQSAGTFDVFCIEKRLNPLQVGQMGAQVFEKNTAENIKWNEGKYISYRLAEDQR